LLKDGDWERLFTWWERQVVIYVGAAVMYMIGKRLKKRHNLMEDVRQSLFQEVNYFLKSVRAKGGAFMGGDEPNLADLAVYGCLNSIEGTRAFAELTSNTQAGVWYDAVRSKIEQRRAPLVASVGASAAKLS
jgi:microsomal prostaglandin-E synthase 2